MLGSALVTLRPLTAALALAVTAASPPAPVAPPAPVGPPWISIEYPANPWNRDTRGAYLLVHAFHHGAPAAFPVSGTAEGVVGGTRRSVRLTFERTSRPGVYALRKQWGDEGAWTLVVHVTQQNRDVAGALIEIAPSGEVARVQVPTQRTAEGDFPRAVSAAEVEASLRARSRA